jgi:hypothetical protein
MNWLSWLDIILFAFCNLCIGGLIGFKKGVDLGVKEGAEQTKRFFIRRLEAIAESNRECNDSWFFSPYLWKCFKKKNPKD